MSEKESGKDDSSRPEPCDLIQGKKFYTPYEIQVKLGIPERRVHEAVMNRDLKYSGIRHHPEILGGDLLRWIQANNVPCEVTELAAKVWRHEQERLRPQPRPVTIADRVEKLLAERARQEEEALNERTLETRRRYATILLKGEAATEKDITDLADLVRELDINMRTLRDDQRFAEAVRKRDGRYAERPREDLARRLTDLARQRPEFFDHSSKPPRLLTRQPQPE